MSDGMGRELAYLSSHATNRYFIPNWGIVCVYINECVGKSREHIDTGEGCWMTDSQQIKYSGWEDVYTYQPYDENQDKCCAQLVHASFMFSS